MPLRLFVLLVVATASAWYFDMIPAAWRAGLDRLQHQAEGAVPQAEPTPTYKWTDANGRTVYGTSPPHDRKAERVSGERGSVSVVEMPKLPPPKPAASEASENLQVKMIEKSIEAQTR